MEKEASCFVYVSISECITPMLQKTRALQRLGLWRHPVVYSSAFRSGLVGNRLQSTRKFSTAVPPSGTQNGGGTVPPMAPYEIPFFSPMLPKRTCLVQEQAPGMVHNF